MQVIALVQNAGTGGDGDKDGIGQGVAGFPGAGRVVTSGKGAGPAGDSQVIIVLQAKRDEIILLGFLFCAPIESGGQGVAGKNSGWGIKPGQSKSIGKGEMMAIGDG